MSSTVLIIDDSRLICRQVTTALSASGFKVVEAADGLEGLAVLESTPGIGLVICDIHMPRMGGLEFLERVRETPSAAVTVIMLTTESQLDMLARAKSLGAKAWLMKPFKAETIVATARKLAPSTQ